mmetsp:Transcript_7044/g.12341  ORF Transcript_7044/g.12341 Transcript_7044/m.12341 type:complete len:209 (+) Transcript_7044:91-717(+)
MAREDRQRRRERRHGRDNPEQGNNPNPNTNNPRETALPAAPGATPIHDPSHPNNHNPNNPNIPASSSIASISQYTEDDGLSSYYDRELSELQNLCDAASESDPTSWDKIRLWLRNHSAEDARAAAERRGDYETTPLHLACRNCPPLDIVNMLLTASPRTVELADSFGWLPLHYGEFYCCNCRAEITERREREGRENGERREKEGREKG